MKRIVGGFALLAAMLVAASAMSDAPKTSVANASSGSLECCGPCPVPCCGAQESAVAVEGPSAS